MAKEKRRSEISNKGSNIRSVGGKKSLITDEKSKYSRN